MYIQLNYSDFIEQRKSRGKKMKWAVYNRITCEWKEFATLRRAYAYADRKDREYGAVICSIKPIN